MTIRALKAGALYFAIVFAAAFVLGTVRVLLIIPRIGQLPAVLLELPIVLALAWVVCLRVTTRFSIPQLIAPRMIMAGSAFLLLIGAELAMSVWFFGNSVADFGASFGTLHGAIGLGGQIAFALFPLIQLVSAGAETRT